MKKSKKTLIALIVAVLAVWGYNFFRLSGGIAGQDMSEMDPQANDKPIAKIKTVSAYKGDFREPFEPLIELRRPLSPKSRSFASNAPQPEIKKGPEPLPVFSVNGIMWDSKKPIAVLALPAGGTKLVSPGDKIDDVLIKAITQTHVTLSKGKQTWTIP